MIIVAALFVFAAILLLAPVNDKATEMNETKFWYAIAVAGLMVVFWLFEVVPIYVTALIPLILGIPLGVLTSADLTSQYGHKFIYLFLGGFILSLALEKWDVHKQIASGIIRVVGTSKSRIILGFLISTAMLSMWISNTATTLMMLPMAMAVLSKIEFKKGSKFPMYLVLAIAYGANVGGMGTLVGSPANSTGAAALEGIVKIDFVTWMQYAIPLSLMILTIVFLFFYFLLGKERKEKIEVKTEKIPWTKNQIVVLILFFVVVLLWSFRVPFTKNSSISYSDESVAILGAVLLFFLPSLEKTEKKVNLLEWKDTERLPWGILILIGGGLAMAKMLINNGVVGALAASLDGYAALGLMAILAILVFISIFGTEVMSNTAMVSVLTPVVAAFAVTAQLGELQLCLPIILAASCAFMLPVGTPPNAIVFASGQLTIQQMAKTGFVLNILAGLIIVIFFSLVSV